MAVAVAPDPKSIIDAAPKDNDFWLYPLPPSGLSFFFFRVDSSQASWQFSLLHGSDGRPILAATMDGQTRADGVSVTKPSGPVIAEGKLDQTAKVVFFVSSISGDAGELCSAVFEQGKMTDLVIPAIKKFEGRSRMCPIRVGESSALYVKMTQNAKEAIRLRIREPPANGDLTFGGKFEISSPANFLLYHESKAKKDLCSFGMCKSGLYAIEIGYPLAPVQGFAGAICATMPA
jgi:hypothetical protein